ncbi:MAG: SIS domain-containing protein [Candidatus Paceibacterota bacterium]|jgi:glucose/mannose-6-phosphate isomerase
MNDYLQHILNFQTQFDRNAVKIENGEKLTGKEKPDGIIICGMGASGNAGKIIHDLHRELNLPQVIPWNDYGLPENNFKNPFYIFASFSGNTEEEYLSIEEYLKGKMENKGLCAVVSSGGKLKEFAEKNKLPLASFEGNGLMPRESLGVLYTAILKILSMFFELPKQFIPSPVSENFKKTADNLATSLQGKIPLIYTDRKNVALGHIWKTNLNETAKMLALTNILPEIFHNEVQVFEKSADKYAVIWIYDEETARRNQKKLSEIHKIFDEKRIVTFALPVTASNREEQIWHSVVLANLVSYNLATLQGLDPTEISVIDMLKGVHRN